MLFDFFLISTFFLQFFDFTGAETHCAIDENDESRICFIGDSPYALRQPHSLIDLFKQVEMVEEKASLKACIKLQQKSLERRYDDDDPDIERRVHETDENCLKSKPLDLQTERFIVTYPIDLVPYFIYDMRFNREAIASTQETLQLLAMERIFDFSAKVSSNQKKEPHCSDYAPFNKDRDEEIDTFSNFAEPELADLNPQEVQKLGSFLTERLKQKSTRHLAFYYSSFYWRLRGETRDALKCLLRYLEDDENVQAPGNFQLGTLYLRVGKYQEAVEIFESVISRLDEECAECHAALGDAYVLVGNFPSAIAAFDEAAKIMTRSVTETAVMKAALLRCVLKVFEVMESQHSTLLGTIHDVGQFKDKSTRLKLLEVLIEANRASPENRLQAKLAYEHFMAGPVPHLNCYGVMQRFLSVFGGGGGIGSSLLLSSPVSSRMLTIEGGVERLHCVVDDLGAFNTSLLSRYRQLLETAFKEQKSAFSNADTKPSRAELFRAETRRLLKEYNAEMVEYARKLAPYMSMEIDEPSISPKYPLKSDREVPRVHWPGANECLEQRGFDAEDLSTIDAFHLFFSPENKGFIVSEILTKYLALPNVDDFSPLPWHFPNCNKFAALNMAKYGEPVDNIDLLKLKSLRRIMDEPSDVYPVGDKRLKAFLLTLSTDSNFEASEEKSAKRHERIVLLGDLGQRIATLLKYRIGADWISLNLAALFLRYFGLYKEAVVCLKTALQQNNAQHHDVAYTQLAQIFIRIAMILNASDLNNSGNRDRLLADAKLLLNSALQQNSNEPLPHFFLGVVAELGEGQKALALSANLSNYVWKEAEQHYLRAFTLEPRLEEARYAILRLRCQRNLNSVATPVSLSMHRSLRDKNPPLCCWPNEQEVYCFKRFLKSQKSNKARRKRGSDSTEPMELCFTLEENLDADNLSTNFAYFRCNEIYTGRSYRPPAYARLISPFLRPAAELRRRKRERLMRLIENRNEGGDGERLARSMEQTPVMALDYGGYSEERIHAHQAENFHLSPDELQQSSITFYDPDLMSQDVSSNNDLVTNNDDLDINSMDKDDVDTVADSRVKESAKVTLSDTENAAKKRMEQETRTLSKTFKPPLSTVTDSHDVLQYDIAKPARIPRPLRELVLLGEKFFPPPSSDDLITYCSSYKKSERILEQPASTYVSVTAKGIRVDDTYLSAPKSSFIGFDGAREPICPHSEAHELSSSDVSSLLEELDALPAYKNRHQLKFYRPETALRDALQNLGETQSPSGGASGRKSKINEVAARLAHAMRASQVQKGAVDWTLSGASSLYWRVKGDALNAVKCLRHSLSHSPDQMKDVALISMANIYQQAGFHYSALVVGGKALDISPNSVVAIHFTLANIYVSLGDFEHALEFYYSTLALQSKFRGAKDRIRAIRCETAINGSIRPK